MAVRLARAAMLAATLATFSARAALFDDDEARKRIDATNQRLTQVQHQLEERISALEAQLKSQGLVELFSQVEQLKSDVARLRGQIEVLTYEQEQQQKRQRDLYVDLDTRLRKLESAPGNGSAAAEGGTAPAEAPVAAPGATAAPPGGASNPPASGGSGARAGALDSAAEQKAYDAALDQFKAGRYGPAIASFSAFVKTYPKSSLAPSAQYWIGNAQFAQRDFKGAIASQRQLIAAYPDSSKVPDAMLNVATAQFELGDAVGSRRTLQDLIAKYPQSDAAAKAKARIGAR
jgi:tol-pal system protein YbgF